MKNSRLFFCALTAAALTSCCGSGNVEHESDMSFSTYSASASFTLKGSASDYERDSDIVVSDSVSLLLPDRLYGDISVEVLRDSILSYAIDSLKVSDPAAAVRGFAQAPRQWSELGYEVVLLDKAVDIHDADGYTLVEGTVVNLTPCLLVYCINNYEYLPGSAHGVSTTRYINFLQSDGGRILRLSDLFTSDGLKQLPARIVDQAEETIDRSADVDITALPDNDNYYISPSGEIVMVYQPYEAAPYSSGVIEVRFYPYELSDLMTPFAKSFFRLGDE